MRSLSPFAALAALAALLDSATAQQFQQQAGAIPGAAQWTEGLEAADIENDGDLDLFFADGTGFSSPGQKRQNVLVVNQLEVAPLFFADESVTRLGAHVSHAKNVVTADIQGDGFVDALFCNAWSTDAPFLYVNNPLNPGFFTFEGAARGFTASYSSGGAQFGDLDDDGDLDVIIADAYLNSGPGKPHLFVNDGNGFFTEDLAFTAAAPTKQAMMDVQLFDVDGDWDLDFLGACRQENGSATNGDHYLMLNDGGGAFTNASGQYPDGSSGRVYEIEVGDLDGDDDLDSFLVSLSNFQEGPIENLTVGSTLGFATGAPVGGDDDNEIALFDYDMDGDLDAFVGSLGAREKVLRNNGALSFTQLNNVIQTIGDSTLDITIADLDNDGAYDLVTGQGESNSGQWANKIYRNTGVLDTLPPRLVRLEEFELTDATGPWVWHALVFDQVADDGRDWVAASARYAVLDSKLELPLATSASVVHGGAPVVAVGTFVRWTNDDAAAHSIVSAELTLDSGPLAPGESFDALLVEPGTYTFGDGIGGAANATITVVGTTLAAGVLKQPGGLYRFRAANPGTAAVRLVFEMTFTDWAGNVRRVSSFSDSAGFEVLGCDLAIQESLVHVAGYPTLGANITLGIDNPLGTQSVGSIPVLAFSNLPDANVPCGTAIPGFGMTGAFGRLLVSVAPPFPIAPLLLGPLWAGAGAPAPITFGVPSDPSFAGTTVFAQGLLLDPSGAGPRFGLTQGLAITIQP
ncbi:MAG: FG-GAP-like repeat-containing protein [Planctomycetota bacterium]